jgi:hypothetical protein
MSPYLNAEVATEHQRELHTDAAAYRRSRTERQPKAHKAGRRYGRNHRVSAFLKDLAAASL